MSEMLASTCTGSDCGWWHRSIMSAQQHIWMLTILLWNYVWKSTTSFNCFQIWDKSILLQSQRAPSRCQFPWATVSLGPEKERHSLHFTFPQQRPKWVALTEHCGSESPYKDFQAIYRLTPLSAGERLPRSSGWTEGFVLHLETDKTVLSKQTRGSQRSVCGNLFLPSTMRVPGTELRPPVLEASISTHRGILVALTL